MRLKNYFEQSKKFIQQNKGKRTACRFCNEVIKVGSSDHRMNDLKPYKHYCKHCWVEREMCVKYEDEFDFLSY